MKPSAFHSFSTRWLFLFTLAAIVVGTPAMAQDVKAPSARGKQKVTIHITREEDGKTIVTDTSFTVDNDFDVPAWIDEQDFGGFEQGEKQARMKHRVIIPHNLKEPLHINMDTIIMNGDTMLFGMNEEDIRIMIPDLPELEGLELDKEIQEALRDIRIPEIPEIPEIPGCCPHSGHFRSIPYPEFVIPGLEGWMPFGRPDEIEVRKSRNGKKVTIRFKDRDEDHAERIYFHHEMPVPEHRKKVVIRKDISNEENQETVVERRKEGDKEIIIIKKKGDSKK